MANKFEVSFTISAIDRVSRVVDRMVAHSTTKLTALQTKLDRLGRGVQRWGAGAMATGAAGLGALALPVRQAMTFEDAMLGVVKQVEGLQDAQGRLDPHAYARWASLAHGWGRELNRTGAEVAELMEAGARMGIQGEAALRVLARTSVMAGDAFGVPKEQAQEFTEILAKLNSNLGRMPTQLEGLGDVINFVDDRSNAKGRQMIEVMTRLSGLARTLNMSAEDLTGWSASFLEAGMAPEVAGTALKFMMGHFAAATTKGKRFQEGLARIHMTAKELQAGMANAPSATMLKVIDRLNALPRTDRIAAAYSIGDAEYGPVLAQAAASASKLKGLLALSGSQAAKGSMDEEFQKRQKLTSAKLQAFSNRMAELGVKLGDALRPALNDALDAIVPLMDRFSGWIDKHKDLIRYAALFGAGLSLVAAAAGGLSFAVGTVMTAMAPVVGLWSKGAGLLGRLMGAFRGVAAVARNALLATLIRLQVAFPGFLGGLASIASKVGSVIGWVARAFVTVATRALVLIPGWGWALMGIVTVGLLVWRHWNKIGPLLAKVWDWLKTKTAAFVAWLGGRAASFARIGSDLGGRFLTALQARLANLFTAGSKLMGQLADGIRAGARHVLDAVHHVAGKAMGAFPQSPAKHGPLTRIHRIRLSEEIAKTITPHPVVQAVHRVGAAVAGAATPAAGRPAALHRGGGIQVSYQVTINGAGPEAEGSFKRQLQAHAREIQRVVAQGQAASARTSLA